jgi:predicted GNAT family N-acyltransferase
MASTERVGQLDRPEQEIPQGTESAKDLVTNGLQVLGMSPSQLAIALDVSPASVSRWINGQATPHQRHLRNLQDLINSKKQEREEPEGLQFHGRNLGIFSLDSFFRRARQARVVYVLKNLLGFQAGINPAVKQQLRTLFAENPTLRICYVFANGSEAAMTFLGFKKEVGSEWPANIFWKEVETGHPLMNSLGTLVASPFILEQQSGSIDVLLEVPVKVLRGLDEFDLSGSMSLLTELSDSHKYRFWSHWKPVLETVKWDSTPVKIKAEKTIKDAIVQVRDRAYDFVASADAYDERSFYVVAEIEGNIVGSIRLTDSQKSSPLHDWAQATSPLPRGKGVVELTRGVVDPSKRNLGIYKWMMLRSMEEARRSGFKWATAAVEEGYLLKPFLHELGFEDVGAPMPYDDSPRAGTLSQSIKCDLAKSEHLWETVRQKLEERSKQKFLNIRYE